MAKKKSDLINCPYCNRQPIVVEGQHNTVKKKVFRVVCVNPMCREPSTAPVPLRSAAKGLWNNKQTTNYMFGRPL
jgi:hypothetical protein